MKKFILKIFLVILVAITVLISEENCFGKAKDPYIKIDNSDSNGITFEISPAKFKSKQIKTKNEIFQLLEIKGFSQLSEPGKPQLPFKGTLIGIPPHKEIKVEVLEAESNSYKGFDIYPSPKIIVDSSSEFGKIKRKYFKDKNTYSKNTFYPGLPVELGFSGMLRDQKVCQIKFYPFQYNPVTKELKFYKRIKARLLFKNPRNYKSTRKNLEKKAGGEGYERLIKDLIINYDVLGRNSKIFNIDKRNNNTAEGMSPYRKTNSGVGGADLRSRLVVQEYDQNKKMKISLEEDGIYKITFTDLKNAGMDLTGVDPKFLKIFNKGKEVAIDINAGDAGYFNEGDYIVFYGEGKKSIYTKTNIYWFYMSNETGLRIIEKDGNPPIDFQPTSTNYKATAHFEEDSIFWRSLPGGEDKDYWFWNELKEPSPSLTENISFELHNIADSSENANLRVALQGKTDDPKDPNHHTKIYLNDTHQIDDFSWNGQTEKIREIPVAQSLFKKNESNYLNIEEIKETGVIVDTIYLNWFEVEYLGKYIAEGDSIKFSETISGTYNFKIDGFTGSDINIFDITDPANVAKIINNLAEQSASGFATKFSITDGTIYEPVKKSIIVFGPDKIQTPSSIVLDEPSSLKVPDNGADYIIITHEDFYDNVLPLAEYRAKEGLRVKTIKVTDIYDEFNYGIFDPSAIKDFLKYAYENWEHPAPTYVLLVGGANEDYKDNLKTGSKNYVPTHLYKSSEMGFTYSDNWFVSVTTDENGNYDILPDMFVGRITKNGSDIDNIVKKIINYEKNNKIKKWKKKVLFVADDDDVIFENVSNELADDYLTDTFTSSKIYLSSYSDEEKLINKPREDIIKGINEGFLITTYTGHGNKDKWGKVIDESDKYMFQSTDIPYLSNKGKETFVINFNCQTGLFAYLDGGYSLAEEFLRAEDKGAISVFAPSGLGYTSEHKILAEYLFNYLFSDNTSDLGFSTTEAKIKAYADGVSPTIVETFILFGDPALRLLTNDNLSIISEILPEGKARIPYFFTFEASGGKPPYRWEIIKGKLPAGLKLGRKKGEISGKPKKSVNYSFKIKLTDSGSPRRKIIKEFNIIIKSKKTL